MSILMKDFAETKGDEIALVDDNGSISWSDFDKRINSLVNGFRATGLTAGDSVAIIAGNRMEWFETSFACAHAGLIGTGFQMNLPTFLKILDVKQSWLMSVFKKRLRKVLQILVPATSHWFYKQEETPIPILSIMKNT